MVKLKRNLDIRKLGDGNVGTQNVWKSVSPKDGILVLLGDLSKGFLAFWLAKWIFPSDPPYELAAISVVLGHDFSVYLKGYGGKGMAATIGFLLAFSPFPTLVGIGVWGIFMLITRHFEISAAVGWGTIPLQIWVFQNNTHKALFAAILFVLIGIKKLIDLPRERRLREVKG